MHDRSFSAWHIHRFEINVREYRRGNKKWTIQKNWEQDKEKQTKTRCRPTDLSELVFFQVCWPPNWTFRMLISISQFLWLLGNFSDLSGTTRFTNFWRSRLAWRCTTGFYSGFSDGYSSPAYSVDSSSFLSERFSSKRNSIQKFFLVILA